jgi:heme exporter protein D
MALSRERPSPQRLPQIIWAGGPSLAAARSHRLHRAIADPVPVDGRGDRWMRNLDFSSWNSVLSTLLGLVLVSLVAVGIRLLAMQTVQRRRERENRQINERLKTLIAAYKILGGSFTGELDVDPSHRREQRLRAGRADADAAAGSSGGAERRRRIRDAVEAALADVILLGTQAQVELAAQAARDMVAGQPVRTRELVVSLRAFIRQALDLEALPATLRIPEQGPLRSPAGGGKGGGDAGGGKAGAGGVGGAAGGAGMGLGAGLGLHRSDHDDAPPGGQ